MDVQLAYFNLNAGYKRLALDDIAEFFGIESPKLCLREHKVNGEIYQEEIVKKVAISLKLGEVVILKLRNVGMYYYYIETFLPLAILLSDLELYGAPFDKTSLNSTKLNILNKRSN